MKSDNKPSVNFMEPARIGLVLIVVLFCGSIAWAHFSEISGAVIATGTVGVHGEPKAIQHVDGGIVEQIHVSAGDRVKKGDILLDLDDTNLAANLAIYRGRLRDALIRRNRLIAEMREEQSFAAPDPNDVQRYHLADISATMEQQRVLLKIRTQSLQGEVEQYDKKIAQLQNQIEGARAIRHQKLLEIDIYNVERSSIEKLVATKTMAENKLLTYDRAVIELRSDIASQEAEIARLENSISEAEIARLQIHKQMRERVASELDELEVKIDEMKQQISATALQLDRTSIRSPIDGIIHELAVHTIGGVIQPAQTIMQIIPTEEDFQIEVNSDIYSVDEIRVGREAVVRFPSFHQRTTPEIFGRVKQVSPSSVIDPKTGAAFYRVRITISQSELVKLGDNVLIPGMPVEAVMPTASRTVLSYLLKPLGDQLARALREQ